MMIWKAVKPVPKITCLVWSEPRPRWPDLHASHPLPRACIPTQRQTRVTRTLARMTRALSRRRGEHRFERGRGVGEEVKVEHLRRGFLEGEYDGSWRYALRAVMLLGHHRTISEATSLPYARRNSRHVSCYISASASPD